MAIAQAANWNDSSSCWRDTTLQSGYQATRDVASTIARFFERVAKTNDSGQTASPPVDILGTQPGTALDDVQRARDELIDWSTYGTDVRGLGYPRIRDAFEEVFLEPRQDRQALAHRLLAVTDAESVLRAALDQFNERGNAERLMLASTLLELYGRAALRPLSRIARAGAPECEYFVDTVASLAADPALFEPISELLQIWARHPARAVRLRLVEVSDALPRALGSWLLNVLADDRDEEISTTAQGHLQSRA